MAEFLFQPLQALEILRGVFIDLFYKAFELLDNSPVLLIDRLF